MGRLTRRVLRTNKADCAYCNNEFTTSGKCKKNCSVRRLQLEKLAFLEELIEDSEKASTCVVILRNVGKKSECERQLCNETEYVHLVKRQGCEAVVTFPVELTISSSDYAEFESAIRRVCDHYRV